MHQEIIDKIEESQWINKYKENPVSDQLKFSSLHPNIKNCGKEQKRLLYQIIFLDSSSPQYWFEYANFLYQTESRQTSRTIQAIKPLLDKLPKIIHNEAYVRLCLLAISASCSKTSKKKYSDLEKQGVKSAYLYLDWSKYERDSNEKDDLKNAIEVIKKGIKNEATPRYLLDERLREYEAEYSQLKSTPSSSVKQNSFSLSSYGAKQVSEQDNANTLASKSVLSPVRNKRSSPDLQEVGHTKKEVKEGIDCKKRKQISGACQRVPQQRGEVEGVIHMKGSKRANVISQNEESAGESSEEEDATITISQPVVPVTISAPQVVPSGPANSKGALTSSRVEHGTSNNSARNPASVSSSSSSDSNASSNKSSTSTAELRRKYLDTLPDIDFGKLREEKRNAKAAVTTSETSRKKEKTTAPSTTAPLSDKIVFLSESEINSGGSDRSGSSLSTLTDDGETVAESLITVKESNDVHPSVVVADLLESSDEMDIVTILECDMPKSVSLLKPPSNAKESSTSLSRLTNPRKRVSFAGNEQKLNEIEEEPSESLASLLQPVEKIISTSEAVPKVTSVDSVVSLQSKKNSKRKEEKNQVVLSADDEIDVGKMKVAKKRKTADSNQKLECTTRFELNGEGYINISVLGKGASSTVYRVMAIDSCQLYAYKRVDMKNNTVEDMEQTIANYSNEINLLNKCKGNPYIIDLVDSIIDRDEAYIGMIMEAGEIDLATSLSNQKKMRKLCNQSGFINPNFLRSVWESMLRAVDHIHGLRIVHGDLKPANFVFVRGDLKLIDFGISKGISNDTTNIIRDSLVGTINYMAPEAVMPTLIPLGNATDGSVEDEKKRVKYGRASDIWSLGCILYQMLYGNTPFASIKNLPSKIGAIVNHNCEIIYPETNDVDAIDAIKLCLVRDLHKRATIRGEKGLLQHRLLLGPESTSRSEPVLQVMTSQKVETKSQSTNTDQIQVHNDFSCSLEKATNLVEFVLEKRDVMIRGEISRRELCQQAFSFLNTKNAESTNNGNSSVNSLQSVPGKFATKKPLQSLPRGLVDQIQMQKTENVQILNEKENSITSANKSFVPGMVKLKDTKSSDSSKWMRPKGKTPEKKDMKSYLQKSLGSMRNFMQPEADDTVDSSFQNDDFSFF